MLSSKHSTFKTAKLNERQNKKKNQQRHGKERGKWDENTEREREVQNKGTKDSNFRMPITQNEFKNGERRWYQI